MAGVAHERTVLDTIVVETAAPLNSMTDTFVNPEPVTRMTVFPVRGPELGEREYTAGAK